jgi:Mn-dependent DtxR family transcriptional regulator
MTTKGGLFMALHESAEMYLETIYLLSQRNANVRSIDIAEHMSYSKPSISRAVGLLKQGGYVAVDSDGFITLTDTGLAVAQKIFERHTLVSQLLIHLGVSEQTAAEDACKIEHVISDETFHAVKKYLEASNALQ